VASKRQVSFLFALALALAQDAETTRKLETARRLKDEKSFAAAQKAYDTALPGLRAAKNHSLLAHALLEGAQAALAAGAQAHALEWGSESARLFGQINDTANETLAENVTGSAQLYLGDYDAALKTFRHALDLDRGTNDGRGEISRLSNIGSIYFFQGKYLDALDTYELAMRRVNETSNEPWNPGRRQVILGNLAILYEQLGQNQKALDYYQQVSDSGSAMTPAEQGQLLSSMGTLYRRLGDAVMALDMYNRAQKILSREHLSDAEIHILQNVGIAQALDFHDLKRAREAFTRALELAESTTNRRETVLAHLFRGEANYRLQDWKEAGEDFSQALDGAREIGAREEQWTALYGRGRMERQAGDTARALATFREAIATIESVRSALGIASLKADFLADKREVYDSAIDLLLRDPSPDIAQVFAILEQARSRNLQDLLRNLRERLTLPAVQAKLHPNEVLVEYWTGSGQVAALWITSSEAHVVSQPLTGELTAALRSLGPNPGDPNWRGAAESAGSILLVGRPHSNTSKELLIVPDGFLYSVPFEALAEGQGAPLVIEQAAVTYLPSAAWLLKDEVRPRATLPWNRQLLAFGDPLVSPSGAILGDERWQRLPDSGRELRSIAQALPGGAQVNAESRDLKRLLFEKSSGVPVLHISTHGVADTTDPNRSRLLFTPEQGQRGSEYLFRSEIQSLALDGVDLVTVSACETEGGKITRGEGIQSFSRAFLSAGVRSTVTTLWRVEDGATADFMRVFYQHLGRGETKAQALRSAKLDFLRSGSDLALPKHWAAFVLNGDGQSSIPPVLSWWWIVGAACAAIALLLIYRRVRRPERSRLTPTPATRYR